MCCCTLRTNRGISLLINVIEEPSGASGSVRSITETYGVDAQQNAALTRHYAMAGRPSCSSSSDWSSFFARRRLQSRTR